MFFSKIKDKNLQEAIKALTIDKVFQQRFGTDSVLDELDAEKDSSKNVLPELCAAANLPILINKKSFSHVKLFQYCFLWAMENPLVRENDKEITELDLDLFFYTLDNEISDSPYALAMNATGEIQRRNLNYDEAYSIARTLINLSFLPLKMFPQSAERIVGKVETSFDCDFLTSTISKVHQVTGCSPYEIMHKMSLNSCCYYYAQWAREQGVKNVEKRPDEEILKSIDYRACVLITERLLELGKLKEEDKEEFLKLISTPPDK